MVASVRLSVMPESRPADTPAVWLHRLKRGPEGCRITTYETCRVVPCGRNDVASATAGRPRPATGAEESEAALPEERHPVHHAELQRGAGGAVHVLPRAGRFLGGHESEERNCAQDDRDGKDHRRQFPEQRGGVSRRLPRGGLLHLPSREREAGDESDTEILRPRQLFGPKLGCGARVGCEPEGIAAGHASSWSRDDHGRFPRCTRRGLWLLPWWRKVAGDGCESAEGHRAENDFAGAADQFEFPWHGRVSCGRTGSHVLDMPSRRSASGEHQQQALRIACEAIAILEHLALGHRGATTHHVRRLTLASISSYIMVRLYWNPSGRCDCSSGKRGGAE